MTGRRDSASSYREQVVAALRATAIASGTGFSWYGTPGPRLPRKVKDALTPQAARGHLLATLTAHLYANLYCPGLARQSPRKVGEQPTAPSGSSFVRALSDANDGTGYWEDGWSARHVGDHEVRLTRDGLTMRMSPDDGWPTDTTSVHMPKESFCWSPGFYHAVSNLPFATVPVTTMVRLYWNLRPLGAVRLVAGVTPLLNKAEMPFRLKVLNDPSRFDRCDAGVLYLRRPDIATAAPLVEQIYRDVYDQLKPLTPAFTRPLAAGLGYADDPGGGRSFGAHRCHLLADAMIQAHETGARTITDRLDSVRRRFDQESVDLDAPFRAGSTAEPIDINIRQLGPPRRRTARGERACGAFLNASHEIGRQLARQASWHRGRCTWLGAASVAGSAERSSASLGPGLYSGCSGIALFLAELARTIGDDQIRATAVGAMEQALATSNSIPEDSRTGLFTGWIGIAFAGVRVGHLVADSRLVERATRLALQAARPDRTEPGFDLISGRSGAIVGLLTLRAMLDDESLLEPAARLGDAVIRSADVTPLGLSWNAAPGVAMKNLTGLSHGAAGAGHALLELAAATGDDGYRAAAMSAFDYERSYFDDRARNWPDFRIDTSVRGRRRLRDFSCTWCHGAPGIGLSRLRGYELFGDESMASDALIALATTREVVIEELHSGAANYSLCHGLAGNAEVLSYGHHVLPSPTAAEAGLVEQVADAGIEAYGGNEQPWPCGAHGGQTPDLMLGLAGIGYFYLRLHDKRVPSPLLLRPEVFREATKGSTLRAGIPQITREESVAPNSSVALGSTRTGRP